MTETDSVECDDEYQPVSVQAYSDKIMVISEGRVIAEHTRHFGRDKIIYNPFALLEKKPGAIRNGSHSTNGHCPMVLKKFGKS